MPAPLRPGFLPLLFAMLAAAGFLVCGVMAQELVVDAGQSVVIAPTATADSYTWSLNGLPAGRTSRTFPWSPQRNDTGVHWFKVDMTMANGTKTEQHWRVRVRIPVPTGSISYFVATDGADDNAGGINDPFATLEKARDTIRSLPRPLPAGGVTVYLRGGTYRRTSTFQLGTIDSGTESAPIVYKAYGAELPTLTTARVVPLADFTALDPAMAARLPAGVAAANIKQLDLNIHTFTYDGPFPARFNQSRIYNPYLTSQDGGLFEVFNNGSRQPLSRYPNDNLADRFATPNLKMDGVTRKYATTLDGAAIGGQFKYKTADESRIVRWTTAAAEGGLWIQGFFRVPWEEYGMKIKSIDAVANTITLAQGASMSLGLGNKYFAYEGSKSEPYWALNLIDEIDQPGEWAVDFIRKRLYIWPTVAINASNLEISDFGSPVVKMSAASHVFWQGIEIRRSLGQGMVVSGGENVTVLGCKFRQLGSYAVDLENGGNHGVVSCDISDMGAGGVYVRGGDGNTTPPTRCNHFVVNNDIQDIAKVTKIYAAGVDAGFGGQAGNGGGGGYKPSVGTRVASNRIAFTHHVGILHGSLEKTIEYNVIDNFCRTNGDMGGIYCFTGLGGDDIIRFNQMTNKAYSWEPYFPGHSIGGSGIQVDLYCDGSKMFGNIIETIRSGFSMNVADGSGIYNNLIVNNGKAAASVGGTPSVYRTNVAALGRTDFGGTTTGTNKTYTTDPGILGRSDNDYRLKTTSPVYADLPMFEEIPVEMIGLFKDEIRTNPPGRKPVIDNPGGATGITQTTATLNGQLDFPFFNPDTTVRVYWGTSDGGTSAANWTNNASLGIRTRGMVSHQLSGLSAKTKYYYRYHASNGAGGTWAASTRSLTTGSPLSIKANNTIEMSSTGSWANGAVPVGGLAVWDSGVTAANSVTIGSGISLLGIQMTNPGGNVTIAPGTGGSLGLGSGGLDLGSSSRTLAISAPVVLTSDQSWVTGTSGAPGSTQITVNGNLSGDGELRIDGTAGRAVLLSGSNTFSGGLVVEGGGRVLSGTTTATATTNAFGTGALILNGGVIGSTGAFVLNGGIAHERIVVNQDFVISPGGRMMIGGTWDLGGNIRTISCTRGTNSGSALASDVSTSWGIGVVGTRSPVISNGVLRVARDSSLGGNFVSFRLHGAPAFSGNAGLILGPGVVSVLAGEMARADVTELPDLTIESGGYFSLSENATPANAAVGSLSGGGTLGNYTRASSPTTAVLTINGGTRTDRFSFSGKLEDNNPTLSALATLGKLNVVKSGFTSQELAGQNTYTGTTLVSGGTLEVSGSIASPSSLTVAAGARLSGDGSIASPTTIHGIIEPSGSLDFSGALAIESGGEWIWNLAGNASTGHPVVSAGSVAIGPDTGLRVEMSESVGMADFSDPAWSSPRVFTLITATAISGNFASVAVSADALGQSHETRGFFLPENTGTELNLRWFPLGSEDGWRFQHFGTMSNAGDAADAADPDLDGFTNEAERAGKTDPNDSGDYPGVIWANAGGAEPGVWSVATNWLGGIQPQSQAAARLDFFTGQSLAAGSHVSVNDLAGDFELNRLVLAGETASGPADYRVTGSPLRFVMQGPHFPRVDLQAGGSDVTVALATPISVDVPLNLHRDGDANFVLESPISGAGGLVIHGEEGSLRITGDNTYSGGTEFASGTLYLGRDGPSGTLGSGPVVMDGQLRIDRTGELHIPGTISGAGGISIYNPTGGDIVTLSGDNRFLGAVVVGGGGLRVRHSNALGTVAKGIHVQTSGTGNLRLDGSAGGVVLPSSLTLHLSNPNGVLINESGDNRVNGPILLTHYSGDARIVAAAGSLVLAGNLSPATSGRGLELSGAGNGNITGNLGTGIGGISLERLGKTGTGKWTMGGTINVCSGGVSVDSGTLDIANAFSVGGGVSVSPEALFSGRATISGGGFIQGNLMPVAMTIQGPLEFTNGARLSWKMTANTDVGAGRVDAGNVIVAGGTTVSLVFDAPGSGVNFQHVYWRSPRAWTLLASSTGGLTGAFILEAISSDAFGQPAASFGTFSLQQSAQGVAVIWSPIPGLPSIDTPQVARVTPNVSPVAVVAADHLLRVAASATGGGSMAWHWSQSSGPGQAVFAAPGAADTFVAFSAPGRYVLRATAGNAAGSGFTEFTVDVAPAISFSLREGVNGYSHQGAFVRGDSPAWNAGARDTMVVGKTSAAARAMFSFGVSSVPRTWPVASVVLELWTHPGVAGSGSVGNLHLRRLGRSITEGTGDGSSSEHGSGTGVDWQRFNGFNSWVNPGGDFDSNALATLAGFNATVMNQPRVFPSTASLVGALQSAMTAGSAFNLVVMAPGTETDPVSNQFVRFASDDHPLESVRPRLTVQFAHQFAPGANPGPVPPAIAGVPSSLAGSVTNATTSRWSLVSGAGIAIFANANAASTQVLFEEPGPHVLRLSAANAIGESGRTLEVNVDYPPQATFAGWQSIHWPESNDPATIGASADPDRDGMSNLLEWAVAADPRGADVFRPSLSHDGAHITFTYTRRKTAPGEVAFFVQWSDSLEGEWSTDGVLASSPVALDADTESVVVTIPVGSLGRRFVRLQVTSQ